MHSGVNFRGVLTVTRTLSVAAVVSGSHCDMLQYHFVLLHLYAMFVQQRTAAAAPVVSMRALVGRISQQGNSYLITGGTDRHIRYWDFQVTVISVTLILQRFISSTCSIKALMCRLGVLQLHSTRQPLFRSI
jgi:hypothetical protein